MMEDNEYESSDADDSDFKPDGLSDDSAPSECDSEENEDDNDEQESEQPKKKKSKKGQKKKTVKSRRTRKKTSASTDEEDESLASKSDNEDNSTKLSPEEEKARADSLWKSFLSDTGTPSKSQSSSSKTTTPSSSSKVSQDLSKTSDKPQTANLKSDKTDQKTNSITSESTSEKSDKEVESITATAIKKPLLASSTRSSLSENGDKQSPLQNNGLKKRGLSSFLSNINKKSKLSTLEKSKLDWNQYKQENDLTEEINSFNRGKNGYLERQDFLQRTDLKQFEIEKNLRNVGKRKLR